MIGIKRKHAGVETVFLLTRDAMKRFGFGVKVNFGFVLQIILLLILTSVVLRILHYIKEETTSLVDSNGYYRVLSQTEIDLYKRMFLIENTL